MSLAWYVLRSKPNKENFFHDQLLAHRLEVFHPRIPVRTVNPRARKVRPYFPGYLFVRADLGRLNPSLLHWMPGSAGLVCFDAEPASVPDGLINAIRRRVEEINAAGGEQLDGLQPGDRVSIEAGPFSGYEAIFDASISGNERVRVLIQFLRGRQLPVELPTGFVQKKKQPA
jgi:transcription antitermination factor NusG